MNTKTTEKQQTQKIDHSIDVRYEPDIIKAFNKFIEKWCGNYYPHLIDTDQNDGEFMRDKLQLAVEKAYQDGYEKGHEAACEFYRSERDILLKDKEKARIEVAEEIFNEFDTRLKKDYDVVDIYLLAGLKAKYLSPTTEKEEKQTMKNVKLEHVKKGWFLTIDDGMTNYTWAVTSEELWCVHKLITDNMTMIMKEIEK